MSKVCVVSRWPTAITTTEVPVVTAASTWARRSPPRSRAVMAAITTSRQTATRLGIRSSTRLCGSISLERRASSATTEGWSG